MNSQLDSYMMHYTPLVKVFCDTLLQHPADTYHGIPQPFLPCFGNRFENAMVKIAIIGRDTKGWGNLSTFLEACQQNFDSIRDMDEFQNLDYVNWTSGKGHRYTFWGFAMYFLSALYGVKNWEIMKQRQHSEILRSFVWGNVNSIEYFDVSSKGKGADWNAWSRAKTASSPFDRIEHITDLFSLDVAIIMCNCADCNRYLSGSGAILLGDKNGVRRFQLGKCLIFNMPHPNGMRFRGGADYYAQNIREELLSHGLLIEMPEFIENGKEAEKIENYIMQHAPRGVSTYDTIAFISNELRKHEATMTVPLLFKIINLIGCQTSYGTKYSSGRGSYRTISLAYDKYKNAGQVDIAESIAIAFRKPNGDYAYEC